MATGLLESMDYKGGVLLERIHCSLFVFSLKYKLRYMLILQKIVVESSLNTMKAH